MNKAAVEPRGSTEQKGCDHSWLVRLERPLGSIAQAIQYVAVGVMVLDALLIICDVIGRAAFNYPISGTTELVRNTVVLIIFSQAPATILEGKMLRVLAIFNRLSEFSRRCIDGVACVLAIVLFSALVLAMWPEMVQSWQIGEMDGSGAIKMPMAPVRTLILVLWAYTGLTLTYMLARIFGGLPPSTQPPEIGH